MSTRCRIRLADLGDLEAFSDHVVRHSAESGKEGSVHFAISRYPARPSVRDSARQRWERAIDEALWGRTFLLLEPGGKVVGHLELRGGRFPSEMHRAVLGMGIERAHTKQGHGARLIEAAIAWAHASTRLTWIDLGVFEHNAPARKLYKRMGFVENGIRQDAFRIDAGIAVTDISMALRLR
ncbi:GNAT family N-acetyltransferase [Polyangium aurulentum]|uniref:GNAT family N-acetyltransferase n=1 Tax=Polyangium aurulentum TaxID=2567896 RepID=UPI0010AE5A9E|nr:GNAT family N-acetyltransferase [Polyangium aurulentum]UQA54850.1 GNAT family N-acetyltransferase [Polyangium aurulentum]